MKGEFWERGDAGIAAVATQPRSDKQLCRSEFQLRFVILKGLDSRSVSGMTKARKRQDI
jgi:hypothetical protein